MLVRDAISDYLRECGDIVIEAASTEAMKQLSEADVLFDAVLANA